MPERPKLIKRLLANIWVLYALVFVAFLVWHIFIFRDVVASIPEIWSGQSVIVREELVPFFDFGTQFWGENTASLTDSDEVRVTYSFWTSWVRHYAVLPIALVLLNTVSAFILFLAFYRIGRYFSSNRLLLGVIVAALAAFFIHFILLYSKVTHFYTLIFGFSLFALSMSLMLEQLFARREIVWRGAIACALLVLINPAIHYHLIFFLASVLFVLLHTFFHFVLSRSSFVFYLKRNLIYFLVVTAISLVPYVIFLLLTVGSSTSVPVNYWMIYYSSTDLAHLFSLDTASQIDMFQYGSYLIPEPRITSMVAVVLVASTFLMKRWVQLPIAKKFFLYSMFLAMLLAVWMSLGYGDNNPTSFHALVREVSLFLADQGNFIAQMLSSAIGVFINILRFPHRFQFIYFYLIGILLTIALLWLKDVLRPKVKSTLAAVVIVVLLVPLALMGSRDYFSVMTSGNFNGFLAPYSIPKDLESVKSKLAETQDNRLLILPTMESGREIAAGGNDYGFIDKFFIYFLNQPTVYYGTAGDIRNKQVVYLAYQAIQEQKGGWDTLLINNLGVTHIMVPKNLGSRQAGLTYLPGIEQKISDSLLNSQKFQSIFEGNDFALYQATSTRNNEKPVLVDMDWGNLRKHFESASDNSRMYLPLQIDDMIESNGSVKLVTDNLERSVYTMYAAQSKASVSYPDAKLLPFTKDIIAGSNFTNNALSLSVLDSKTNQFNSVGERLPSLAGIPSAQFVGLERTGAKINLALDVPTDGMYRVLLHAASKQDGIETSMGGHRIKFQKIGGDPVKEDDYIDFSYYYADLDLVKGKQTLTVSNPDNEALVLESSLTIPQSDIPQLDQGIDTDLMAVSPTETPGEFEVTFKGSRL